MNNLKRVLSLALSGIMLVGMMAIGASAADFTDAADIEHDDAVNVLVALNVINGKDDGTFDPNGDVTRGQMAKMIAVAMNGGKDANTGVKGTASFTDIKGHWAESYIEYCYDMGIISGRGDGTFDPEGKVTGLEATKMVLSALGYDSTAYRLTGASWAVRTDELAKAADPNIYDELGSVAMANAATRDTAAQLIWNGMQNRTKRVTPQTNTSTGEVTWTYGDGKGTLLKERYDADILVGNFSANHDMDSTAEKGEIIVSAPKYDKDGELLEATDDYCVPAEFDIDNIGEEVKVIYKNGKNSKTDGPDRNDTIYGVFLTGATEAVRATKADVKDNKAAEAKIKVGSTKYTLAATVTVVTNYDTDGQKDVYTAGDKSGNATDNGSAEKGSEKNSDLTDALKGKNGDTVKLLIKDNKVETIYIVESKLAVVTTKNATKIGINNGVGTLTIADHDIEDDLKVDDVVEVSVLYAKKAADGVAVVKKAETVDGEVDEYEYDVKGNSNKGANKNITVDGKNYKVMDEPTTLFTNDLDDGKVETLNDSGLVGEEVTLYLVNGYVAAIVQTTESASNYSVVTDVKKSGEAGATFDALQVQVMDSTGTKKIYNVAKKSDAATAGQPKDTDYPKGTLVTYTVNKDGEAVLSKVATDETTKAADAVTADDTGYEKSIKSFQGTVTSKDCVLFATNGQGSWKAYNLRDLNDVKVYGYGDDEDQGVAFSYGTKNDKVVAVAIDMGKTPKGVTSSAVYAVVSSNGKTAKVGDDTYKRFTAVSNDETYTLNVPEDEEIGKGDIVWFQPTADNTYDGGDVIVIEDKTTLDDGTAKVVYVDSYDKDDAVITFFTEVQDVTDDDGNVIGKEGKGDATVLAVDSKVAIYGVDVDNDTSPEASSVGKFDTVNGYKNAILIVDDDTVVTILVETSGEGDIV